ncbi:MAG: hypothetical protein J2P25_09720 [Nocardiopsaceae bacterium]|nr:hypothetical protein [Nocardiopsaceae bacterium]
MPDIAERRREIETLITENEKLEVRLSKWQQEDGTTEAEIQAGQRQYHDWYARAQPYVPAAELDRFRDMYEGGTFIHRIKAFLTNAREKNSLYDPSTPNPFVDRWQEPFSGTCQEALVVQRQILAQALHDVADVSSVLDDLSMLYKRLPDFISTLRLESNPSVPAPNIENEKDLQVLVHAILRLHYPDVRPEDPVPQRAGAGSRMDFLIRDAGIIVETKMTRKSLTDRKVGEELLIDWGRYQRHPDCRAIFALVYDPGRYLRNPAGLEHDLSQDTADISSRVIVVC